MSLFQLVETNLSMVLYKTRTLTEKQQNLTTPKKTESIQLNSSYLSTKLHTTKKYLWKARVKLTFKRTHWPTPITWE